MVLMSLTGCAEKSKELNVNQFQSRVVVKSPELEMTGIFDFENKQSMSFRVVSPKEINGVTVKLSGGLLKAESDDVSVSVGNMNESEDIYSPLFEAVSLLCTSQVRIPESGRGKLSFEGSRGSVSAEISYDDGKILSIDNDGINYCFLY